ncbi:MAG TPA: hypothetical protein VJB64_03035, partial [Patescibacteria group bacterium]|nr:hypothetical protein [Patescibacteria group bacterium]
VRGNQGRGDGVLREGRLTIGRDGIVAHELVQRTGSPNLQEVEEGLGVVAVGDLDQVAGLPTDLEGVGHAGRITDSQHDEGLDLLVGRPHLGACVAMGVVELLVAEAGLTILEEGAVEHLLLVVGETRGLAQVEEQVAGDGVPVGLFDDASLLGDGIVRTVVGHRFS